MSKYVFFVGDKSTAGAPLKVGDVCRDPERLREGMKVRFAQPQLGEPLELFLRAHGSVFESKTWVCDDDRGTWVRDEWVRSDGVTILALPEEATEKSLPSGPAIREMHDIMTARMGGRLARRPR